MRDIMRRLTMPIGFGDQILVMVISPRVEDISGPKIRRFNFYLKSYCSDFRENTGFSLQNVLHSPQMVLWCLRMSRKMEISTFESRNFYRQHFRNFCHTIEMTTKCKSGYRGWFFTQVVVSRIYPWRNFESVADVNFSPRKIETFFCLTMFCTGQFRSTLKRKTFYFRKKLLERFGMKLHSIDFGTHM